MTAKIWTPGIVLFLTTVLDEAHAQEAPELVTDRPDQTESSVVVPPGFFQIETGVLYTEEGDESRTLEYPGTLFRIGLVNRLELRIGFSGWVNEFEGDDDGFGDSELGFKVYIAEEKGPRPEIALLASVSIPTGESGFSSERFDPSFRFAFSHTISEKISLGYNVGMAWETFEHSKKKGDRLRAFAGDTLADATIATVGDPAVFGGSQLAASAVSVLLDRAFGQVDFGRNNVDRDTMAFAQYTFTGGIALTERLGLFLELFGDVPINAPGKSAHSFDAGFTVAIQNNIQWDIAAGVGLSADADDWFVGTGITFRFPR